MSLNASKNGIYFPELHLPRKFTNAVRHLFFTIICLHSLQGSKASSVSRVSDVVLHLFEKTGILNHTFHQTVHIILQNIAIEFLHILHT